MKHSIVLLALFACVAHGQDVIVNVYRNDCQYQPHRGGCTDYVEKWYFDLATQTCLPFQYGGCAGNSNRFETEAICTERCQGSFPEAKLDGVGAPPPSPGGGPVPPQADNPQGIDYYGGGDDTENAEKDANSLGDAPKPAGCVPEAKKGYMLNANYNYLTTDSKTLDDCQQACNLDSQCRALHYFPGSRRSNCLLLSKNDEDLPERLKEMPEELREKVTYYRSCK